MMPRASSGTVKAVRMKEMISAEAIVSDRNLKNAPVMPERKASGTKMMMVARLEPNSGLRNSRAACEHRRVRVLDAGHARAARDVLDHDDHIVDQQADGRRDAAERHDVEASCRAATAAAR